MPEERFHRVGQEEARKDDFEDAAFQDAPHKGAWTGGWKDLPERRTWLDLAERARGRDEIPTRERDAVRRTDAELLDALTRALEDVEGAIHVRVAAGSVALAGRVASQAAKLDAQRRAGNVAGVDQIHNLLDVGAAGGHARQYTSS